MEILEPGKPLFLFFVGSEPTFIEFDVRIRGISTSFLTVSVLKLEIFFLLKIVAP